MYIFTFLNPTQFSTQLNSLYHENTTPYSCVYVYIQFFILICRKGMRLGLIIMILKIKIGVGTINPPSLQQHKNALTIGAYCLLKIDRSVRGKAAYFKFSPFYYTITIKIEHFLSLSY